MRGWRERGEREGEREREDRERKERTETYTRELVPRKQNITDRGPDEEKSYKVITTLLQKSISHTFGDLQLIKLSY